MKTSIAIIFLLLAVNAFGQSSYSDSINLQRDTINIHFKDSTTSILGKAERKLFTAIDFYAVNDTFNIPAKFRKKWFQPTFEMPTSTSRKPIYKKYGILKFELNGQRHRLIVYQNIELSKLEDYADYLFCPFKDLTNGDETYGGGRYLDMRIGDLKADPRIDFNLCYNPYCAYNYKYSCPIPPKENHLKTRIEAGVKNYKHLSESDN